MKSLILEASCEHALLAESQGAQIHLSGGPSLSKSLGAEVKKFTPPFQRIIIGTGPGSFTGIRVVAAMAQALAFGWNIPLYTTSSLTAFAPHGHDLFAVAMDARSGGIYVQVGHGAAKLLKLEEAEALFQTMPLITSPHPTKILQRLPRLSPQNWQETKPCPLLLEQYAVLAEYPLKLNYLSHL